MEVLNKHFVNFDFDLNLLSQKTNFHYKNQKLFEFVYFLINKDSNNTLCTHYKYEKEYLNYLASLGFVIPKISNDFNNVELWWGNFDNIDIKQKLMSKYELTNVMKESKLIPDFVKVVNKGEIITATLENKVFYRKEFGFSGLGNMVLDNQIQALENGTIAPVLDVVKAFGITLDLETEEFFICENLVNEKGNFLGGQIISCDEISKLLSIDPQNVKNQIIEICRHFKKLGAVNSLQFDSLIYRNNDQNFWYKVVEVNYRKTMGLAIKKVTDLLGSGKFLISKEALPHAIELSSPESKLKCFYLID